MPKVQYKLLKLSYETELQDNMLFELEAGWEIITAFQYGGSQIAIYLILKKSL